MKAAPDLCGHRLQEPRQMHAWLRQDRMIPPLTKHGGAKKVQPWRRKGEFARSPKISRFYGNRRSM